MTTLLEDTMPGGCHPAYDSDAPAIRTVMGTGVAAVRVPYGSVPAASYFASDDLGPTTAAAYRVRTLDVRRCVGPAPWVGWPAYYEWRVAVDELGRAVAGSAERLLDDHAWWRWPIRPVSPAYYEALPELG